MNEDLKKAYEEKTEAQLKEWSCKIEGLKNRAENLSADAKVKALEKTEELKKMVDDGRKKLDQLRQAGQDNWDDLKAKSQGVMDGIRNSMRNISSKDQHSK